MYEQLKSRLERLTATVAVGARRTTGSHRSERGVSSLQTITTLALAASLGGLVSATSTEQVGAAETAACRYEHRIIVTAVDVYAVTSDEKAPPVPAGTDGLDAVRDAGLMRQSSIYWRYTGVDETSAPKLELQQPIADCS